MTHPNGTDYQITHDYTWTTFPFQGRIKALWMRIPTGVIITYPCGTKRWISDTWYDEETLKELFAR
jgi:hypothetical protein